ncbi:MAG: hypothetical protein OXL96_16235 [Candidatus Poribacteria bacterium]|nr:hypothetical protein [Candidatus Poribacteria bacterium]
MTRFSIVMPFRDTPRERKFAEKSIPSAIALEPDEFLIGVDEPADESFLALISRLCAKQSFTNYRILPVPKSDKWRFQLANIIWHCYQECRNDRILAFDVDSILRPAVLNGLGFVGRDGNAVVSFTKRLPIESAGDLIRYVSYRLRVMTSSHVFGGVYWIYRPYYWEDVDLEGMMSIQNGIDTYMMNRVLEQGRHKTLTLKEIGVYCMDRENGDYPWRQFQDGVWCYANKERFRDIQRETRNLRSPGARDIVANVIDRSPTLLILLKSIAYCYPWLLRGWLWARQNPDHEAVSRARDITREAWSLVGSQYIKNLRDWERHGRRGTGFD